MNLHVNVGEGYDIIIEKGCMQHCGSLIRTVTKATKAVILSDSNVAPLYAEGVKSALTDNGFEVFLFTFPAGERSKTFATIGEILNFTAEKGLTRGDVIVALGGGVTGDMAGVTASIYLRGIHFIQIPTSLLAMVDSSVGGKTGCDLPAGKNLTGSFWQPSLVLIDPLVLQTLPDRYYSDGLSEAIKAGAIKSKALFDRLCASDEDIIFESVDIKRAVVEADEKETGERKLLNFGHTLAHSIEKYYHFETVSHGEAVSIGMVLITKAAETKGLTRKGTAEKLKALLQKNNLPVTCEIPLENIIPLCFNDKKRLFDTISLVLLKDIGDSFIYDIKVDNLNDFLMEGNQ